MHARQKEGRDVSGHALIALTDKPENLVFELIVFMDKDIQTSSSLSIYINSIYINSALLSLPLGHRHFLPLSLISYLALFL